MPYKDPEARKAYSRARYARLVAEDDEKIKKRKAREAKAYQRRKAEEEGFEAKRKADYQRWYAEYGKDNARERKGYKPWEEWQAECDAKRRATAEYMREWSKTEAGQRNRTAQSVKKRCGLTIEEYDQAYDEQGGMCAICRTQRERYGDGRLVVDHCHRTGEFRGLLCAPCNSAIGLFNEDITVLEWAIEYIKWCRGE